MKKIEIFEVFIEDFLQFLIVSIGLMFSPTLLFDSGSIWYQFIGATLGLWSLWTFVGMQKEIRRLKDAEKDRAVVDALRGQHVKEFPIETPSRARARIMRDPFSAAVLV